MSDRPSEILDPPGADDDPRDPRWRERTLAWTVVGLGVLALLVPFWPELVPEWRLGVLLLATAIIELLHSLRRADAAARRSAWFGGAVTLSMGVLLMVSPALIGGLVVVFVAGWFALDALRWGVTAVRAWRQDLDPRWSIATCVANLGVIGLISVLGSRGVLWTLAIAAALRIFGTAANMVRALVLEADDAGDSVVRDLGLDDQPELRALGDSLEAEEATRRPVDRYWIGTFVLTLFAIHLGRMGLDRTTLGIVSPAFAVVGDLAAALGVGLGLVIPLRILLHRFTRPIETRAWRWCQAKPVGPGGGDWRRRCVRFWLTDRMRFAIRMRQARYSVRTALSRGLQIGLPAAAVLAATMPIWGMSWYFDTENYAAGIWNSWAEARTDLWREAMIRAVQDEEAKAGRPAPAFKIEVPEVSDGADFSFIIIGDTGEGDASQHILRDSLIRAAGQPEVRFVVISSDVVYPTGEMKDYEANFWLPFKGVHKPIFAIPGNHDWYDALEAFAATFLEADAARTVMRARVNADLQLTGTTDRRIEELLGTAARLRKEYGVPTGFQKGPMLQFQTDRFALFAVDTGVRKRLDTAELAWFKSALESARGKFKMAILGHPLYACGVYRATLNEDFAGLHRLLRAHDVRVVVAGDTHDFEYYAEPGRTAASPGMHHFVNGGGGAFLTMGVQLADPKTLPVKSWAFHPPTAPLVAKIEAHNAFWKAPLWWWTRELKAWPSAPEWLSAAFDYNVAPFFQSFLEVRVEPSAQRVRLLPWGVHGRLRWADLQTSEGLRPEGVAVDAPVEWTFDLAAGSSTPVR